MTLETVITTVLSVPFLFGAATAIAFRRAIRGLFEGVLSRASSQADSDETSKRIEGER